jgi:hypothetical protein
VEDGSIMQVDRIGPKRADNIRRALARCDQGERKA